MLEPEVDSWAVPSASVSASDFITGVIGPYRLGPSVRQTRFGEVIIALEAQRDVVVELDLYDGLADTVLSSPDGSVLLDVAHVVGVHHRHVAPIIASGFAEGVPYVVRAHRLGRTVEQLLEARSSIPLDVAASLLFCAAEAVAFLGEQGPSPGACAMGGVTASDVFVGFDGAIKLVGLGLKRARGDGDPIAADIAGLRSLAAALGAASGGGLMVDIADVHTAAGVARAVRRKHGSACAARRRLAATVMRRVFVEEIDADRAFFGLPTLQ